MSSAGSTKLAIGRVLAIWVLIAVVETIHGVLRGLLLVPEIGDLRARQLGVLMGSVLILLVARVTRDWLGACDRKQQWQAGLIWALLMLGFEIGLGRALGFSWQRIASDYDPSQGGWMLLGMLVLAAAPRLVSRRRAP